MGGKSSSSSSSNTTNVTGQNAIDGDNLGTAISGVNNSTVNVTATDHGAVAKAFELGEKSFEFGESSLDMVENAVGETLGFADSTVKESLGFAENAMDSSMGLANNSLRFADNALDESLGFADGIFDDALGAVSDSNERTLMFAENALDEYSATNSENLQMVAGLAGNQAEQNTKNISAMMELAKFNKDGGQSQLNKQQLILVGIIIVVMGVVAAKAVK
jgi:hypothetical protein